jgi:polyphosphate glucokinase
MVKRVAKKILVVDVGGTHIKILATGQKTKREVASGPKMTARQMCAWVNKAAADWPYDVASIGYPAPVVHGKPFREPYNLGKGWVGFDYRKALGCPVKIMNDAAMQALGSYKGGRMLFLGLGTGLGAAMIVDGVVEPMELAHLPYQRGKTYEDYLGARGLKRLGKKRWRRYVTRVVEELQSALNPDYVVLGGGNVKKIKTLPPKTRLGDNNNAFVGGYRLWSNLSSDTWSDQDSA